MGYWLKRMATLEKRVTRLERRNQREDCAKGDHSFELLVSPFAKCKYCNVGGKITETVKIDTSDKII